ncbi:hypothetical protein P9X10_01555 [Bacillus cereus]|nr:hypothetical protein [Bacillus cereus]
MWLTVAYASFIAGVLFLVITVVLCMKWDIVNIYDTITGRKAKRQIKKYKERDEGKVPSTDSLTSGLSPTKHMDTEALEERESLLEKSRQSGYKVLDSKSLIKSPRSEQLQRAINNMGLDVTGGLKKEDIQIDRTEIISEDSMGDAIEPTQMLSETEINELEQGENLSNHDTQPSSVRLTENGTLEQEISSTVPDVTEILIEEHQDATEILSEEDVEKTDSNVVQVAIQSSNRITPQVGVVTPSEEATAILEEGTAILEEEGTAILDEGTAILDEGTAILSEDGDTSRLDEVPTVNPNKIIIKQRGSSYAS